MDKNCHPDDCIFCAIIRRETPAYIVYEDDHFIAFLDKRPVFIGHTLLLPKKHYPTFYDLPNDMLKPFFFLTQTLGQAIEKGLNAQGLFTANNNKVSQSVMHVHFHLIPRNFKDGLKGFFWPRHTHVTEAEMRETAERIKKAIPPA
jgi:histidine triad (HIT) family protein